MVAATYNEWQSMLMSMKVGDHRLIDLPSYSDLPKKERKEARANERTKIKQAARVIRRKYVPEFSVETSLGDEKLYIERVS